jgi:hypothetical protein
VEDESIDPHENLARWTAKLREIIASGLPDFGELTSTVES